MVRRSRYAEEDVVVEEKEPQEGTVECERGHNMLRSDKVCKKCGAKEKEAKDE